MSEVQNAINISLHLTLRTPITEHKGVLRGKIKLPKSRSIQHIVDVNCGAAKNIPQQLDVLA